MLNFKVPYTCSPAANVKRSVDLSGGLSVSDEEFVNTSKKILSVLKEKYPNFMFSHKINLIESEQSLINDIGTELMQKDRYFDFTLIVKHRESANMLDGLSWIVSRDMDYDMILDEMAWACESYNNKVDFSEEIERVPVVMLGGDQFYKKFLTDLEGDTFGSRASLFSGKTGEKLFNDNFSLMVDRDAKLTFSRFFDGEGVVLPEDSYALIESGVLKAPYTSKRIAEKHGLPITGSASLDYDSAPYPSPESIVIARSDKTIKELLGGRTAIYVVLASGGDFTPQGEYASPIQVAYLFDGDNFLGRLPQLAMSSTVGEMFGKDFIGASSDGSYPNCPFSYVAIDMNVKKIDNWM